MSARPAQNPVICVFGGSDDVYRKAAIGRLAEATGRVLAELGYVVANGGYGGTMEACSRGAKQAGGRTIGVTCSLWSTPPNAYIDEVIATSDFTERLLKLLELGTGGYVVLPGANGTLTELSLAWERKCVRQQHRRPIVCVGRFWQPLITLISSIRPASAGAVAVIDEPAELRRYLPPAGGLDAAPR
ncbi:MAG: LOG family protein [Phycisphaerae bacterium]|jgi:uncharacterized protein (TIGR00730 family)